MSTDPPGANIFINGMKQPGQTPTTLHLATGQYNLVLRLAGSEPYSGTIEIKDKPETKLEVEMKKK